MPARSTRSSARRAVAAGRFARYVRTISSHASLRGGREVAGDNADGVERRYPDGVLGDVVGQRLRREHDAPPEPAIDGEHDLSGGVLLAPHRPFAPHDRPIRGVGAGRPGAQKERLGDERVSDDGEVPREMVAFEPPTPRAVTWRAEDGHEVAVGVEGIVDARGHALEHALKRHDVERLRVAGPRGARSEQGECDPSLSDRHLSERKPVPRHRGRHRPVPPRALGAFERKRRLGALGRRQRREQRERGGFDIVRRYDRRSSCGADAEREPGRPCGRKPQSGAAGQAWVEGVVVHVGVSLRSSARLHRLRRLGCSVLPLRPRRRHRLRLEG